MSKSKKQFVGPMNIVNYEDLIINNPEKQAFWIRWGFHLLTLVFWVMWGYLWTPLPGLINNFFLSDFSAWSFQPSIYIVVVFTLLITLISWQIGWVTYNKKRYTDRTRPPKKDSLSHEELGFFFDIDTNKLEYWQQSKCLVMHHHDTGEIEAINANDFFSFSPSLPKTEEGNQGFRRYHIILVPTKANAKLFIKHNIDFIGIMKVLCAVFKISYVNCEKKKYSLCLTADIPLDFKLDNLVSQLKIGSSSVINRKYNTEPNSTMFWYSQHLLSAYKLPDRNIENLVKKVFLTTP